MRLNENHYSPLCPSQSSLARLRFSAIQDVNLRLHYAGVKCQTRRGRGYFG